MQGAVAAGDAPFAGLTRAACRWCVTGQLAAACHSWWSADRTRAVTHPTGLGDGRRVCHGLCPCTRLRFVLVSSGPSSALQSLRHASRIEPHPCTCWDQSQHASRVAGAGASHASDTPVDVATGVVWLVLCGWGRLVVRTLPPFMRNSWFYVTVVDILSIACLAWRGAERTFLIVPFASGPHESSPLITLQADPHSSGQIPLF